MNKNIKKHLNKINKITCFEDNITLFLAVTVHNEGFQEVWSPYICQWRKFYTLKVSFVHDIGPCEKYNSFSSVTVFTLTLENYTKSKNSTASSIFI